MENDTRTSYGIELFANKNGSDNSHRPPVEEIGHTLSADLFYEKSLGHIAECYSGDFCVGQFGVGGGDDETPETVDLAPNNPNMSTTGSPNTVVTVHYGFSLEELMTIDFRDIPSTND
jgi:hypothetical protein